MLWKLVKNDLRHQPLQTFNIAFFIFLAVTFLATASQLTVHLTNSINQLVTSAKTPHILQMHTGDLNRKRLEEFVEKHQEISDYQVLNFLNIDNAELSINGHSLKDSVYDNGFSVQSPRFDFLQDLDGQLIEAEPGQVYVPIFYYISKQMKLGDRLTIGDRALEVVGFVRDSQMNSSLSVSRRFVISQEDYDALEQMGSVEYLIEFRLHDLADSSKIETAYNQAGLEADGPPLLTYTLFQLINAFSDGMTILALIVISLLIILIALFSIRLTLLAKLEEDYRELSILKAIGIPLRNIQRLFLSKYLVVAGLASSLGFLASFGVKQPLLVNMKIFFGESQATIWTYLLALAISLLVFSIIAFSMGRLAKQLKYLSLNPDQIQEREVLSPRFGSLPHILQLALADLWARKKIYTTMLSVFVLSLFVVLLPMSIYSTISHPSFINYLGLGNYDIRVDLSQISGKEKEVEQLISELETDPLIQKISVYRSYMLDYKTETGNKQKLWVDTGNQKDFSIKYIKGHAPTTDDQISLSKLRADDMEKKVGDQIPMLINGQEKNITISGIYSDLTNGGKTAKASFPVEHQEAVWIIIPITLKTETSSQDFIKAYQDRYTFAKFSDIESYRNQIFGSTIQMVSTISWWAFAGAIFLVLLITSLFIRMLFIKDLSQIALLKAIGFSNKQIQLQYVITSSLILILSLVIGNFFALTVGDSLASLLLSTIGIAGVTFIHNPLLTLLLIPLSILTASLLATRVAISDLHHFNISQLIKEDN
ncbi:ABC transporter permease [Streptococcus minor]|uniref:ABC transporter permease n=1 Tax=Streptococcus minor TaxID=229549 RepID=A0A3P1VA68_9STRE|nr:FtsX-like permease family protein [Streptococcus minor]RRD30285.1 ABC transporter permease [Streptococcus minor]